MLINRDAMHSTVNSFNVEFVYSFKCFQYHSYDSILILELTDKCKLTVLEVF